MLLGDFKVIHHVNNQFRMTSLNMVLHNSFMNQYTYSNSCLDQVLTSQENLVTNLGVHSSLNPKCHHHFFFFNSNLKKYYPPSHESFIWKYEKANADLLKRAIRDFD